MLLPVLFFFNDLEFWFRCFFFVFFFFCLFLFLLWVFLCFIGSFCSGKLNLAAIIVCTQ